MLHITTTSHLYSCQPKTKDELRSIIIERMKKFGTECDLNDIDVSKIDDMSYLFDACKDISNINAQIYYLLANFNGDISMWDVSNVKNMHGMFNGCCEKFNCDLSDWDVSNVKDMSWMFANCYKFNRDLSKWNVSNVKNMGYMFYECPAQPKWYK